MLNWVIVQGMALPSGYEPSGKWDLTNADRPTWLALGLDASGNVVQVKELL